MKISSALLSLSVLAAACPVSAQIADTATNNNETSPYAKSQVQAQIRIHVDKDTEKVHFIRDNTDPYVITKAYVIKYADPYEIRLSLQDAFKYNQITQDNTQVDMIKYNDGYSVVLVSAEDNRFEPQRNGMSVDEIVKQYDRPKITASTGSSRYLYFPMYRSAAELSALIYNVGMAHPNDPYELQAGKDFVDFDSGINALFFYVPFFSKKNIDNMLKVYDNPIIQATVTYTIYEVYAENDGKIGADFQSWKNNEGLDFLSVGGRYRSNWTSTWADGIAPTGSNKTQYFNFNPKWNSRYLDFLVSKGRAEIMNTGEIVVRNNNTAIVNKSTGLFYNQYTPIAAKNFDQTIAISNKKISSTVKDTTADYYFVAKDTAGTTITIVPTVGTYFTGNIGVVKIQPNGTNNVWYNLTISGSTLVKDGKNLGEQTEAYTFTLYQKVTNYSTTAAVGNNPYYTWVEVPFVSDVSIEKGNKIDTMPSTAYGFNMELTPQIFAKASVLKVKASNSSLMGWQSNGLPRISRNSTLDAEVMLSNNGTRFIIGGLEKREVVRSVSGLPWLRKIPVLGWLFSSESESTKLSHLVIVGECRLSEYDERLRDTIAARAKELDAALKNSGKKLQWGFDQYGIDSDRQPVPTLKAPDPDAPAAAPAAPATPAASGKTAATGAAPAPKA